MGKILKINKYPGLCGLLTKESTLLDHRDTRFAKHLRNGLLHAFFTYIKQVKLAKIRDDFSDFSEYLEKILLAQIFICLFNPDFYHSS